MVGAEALIRWQHPELGAIPPMDFIPAAERTGQIVPMGNWVISEVCRHIGQWQEAQLAPVKIAINISLEQLRQLDYVNKVRAITDAAGWRRRGFCSRLRRRQPCAEVIACGLRDGDR
jgi:EAL domain-containing protein (putative c-di-GMP-specific phosphodiesterase class I)